MEDPEAAAEEYREKVTQSRNSAGRVVNAKAPAPGWFLPKDRKWTAGLATSRRKGCGSPREGREDGMGNPGWGQRVELGDGKRNPWKFPIFNRGRSTETTPERRCPAGCCSVAPLLEITYSTPRSFFARPRVMQSEDMITSEWHPRPRLTEKHQIWLRGKGWRGVGRGERRGRWAELGEKTTAKESERAGIPMQSIPRHSKRARVVEASRESRKLEN